MKDKSQLCRRCKGAGKLVYEFEGKNTKYKSKEKCPFCNGSGKPIMGYEEYSIETLEPSENCQNCRKLRAKAVSLEDRLRYLEAKIKTLLREACEGID